MRWQLWGDIEFTNGTMSRRVISLSHGLAGRL